MKSVYSAVRTGSLNKTVCASSFPVKPAERFYENCYEEVAALFFLAVQFDVFMIENKVKVKGRVWGLSALQHVGRLYPCPNEVPSFISRGATHHIGTRDLC